MCFRPGDTAIAVNCPSCGKQINPVAGQYPPFCPWCDETLTEEALMAANPEAAAAQGGGTPGAPGAPKPPVAPGAPTPPKAPGAPKPPGA